MEKEAPDQLNQFLKEGAPPICLKPIFIASPFSTHDATRSLNFPLKDRSLLGQLIGDKLAFFHESLTESRSGTYWQACSMFLLVPPLM